MVLKISKNRLARFAHLEVVFEVPKALKTLIKVCMNYHFIATNYPQMALP